MKRMLAIMVVCLLTACGNNISGFENLVKAPVPLRNAEKETKECKALRPVLITQTEGENDDLGLTFFTPDGFYVQNDARPYVVRGIVDEGSTVRDEYMYKLSGDKSWRTMNIVWGSDGIRYDHIPISKIGSSEEIILQRYSIVYYNRMQTGIEPDKGIREYTIDISNVDKAIHYLNKINGIKKSKNNKSGSFEEIYGFHYYPDSIMKTEAYYMKPTDVREIDYDTLDEISSYASIDYNTFLLTNDYFLVKEISQSKYSFSNDGYNWSSYELKQFDSSLFEKEEEVYYKVPDPVYYGIDYKELKGNTLYIKIEWPENTFYKTIYISVDITNIESAVEQLKMINKNPEKYREIIEANRYK